MNVDQDVCLFDFSDIVTRHREFVNNVGLEICNDFKFVDFKSEFKLDFEKPNTDLLQTMDGEFKKSISSQLSFGMQMYLTYRSARTLGYMYVDHLDQAILEACMRFMPITSVVTLAKFYFPEYGKNDVINWCFQRTKGISGEIEDILRQLLNYNNWKMLAVNYNVIYYPIIIGDLILNKQITNLENDIIRDFGDFIHLLMYNEAEHYEKLITLVRLPNTETPILDPNVKDITCTESYDFMSDSLDKKFVPPANFSFFKESNVKHPNLVAVTSKCKYSAMTVISENRTLENIKSWAMKVIYKNVTLNYWYEILQKEYFFSIFYTPLDLKLLQQQHLEFYAKFILCDNQTIFWNGVDWCSAQDLLLPASYSSYANIKVGNNRPKNSIDVGAQNVQTCMSNVFNCGRVYYPFFNRFEISSPAHTSPTRSPILEVDSIKYMLYDEDVAKEQTNQMRTIAMFYKIIDNVSFLTFILHEDLYSKVSPPISVVLDLMYRIDIYFINKLYRRYVLECPQFCMDMLNLALQINKDVLNPDVFTKLFFDVPLEEAATLGNSNNYSYMLNNSANSDENEEEESTAGSFEESIMAISAKLLREISKAPKIENSKESRTHGTYFTEWDEVVVNSQNSARINRMVCFQTLSRFKHHVNKSFNFESVPDQERRLLVAIITLLIRTRRKTIPEDHVCINSSINSLFDSSQNILSIIHSEFPRKEFHFNSNDDKIRAMLDLEAAVKSKNNQFPWWTWTLKSLSYWRETMYGLNFLYHFADFNLENFEAICSFIKYIDFPGNHLKRFMYLVGSSNSAKSLFCQVLGQIYNCLTSKVLSSSALSGNNTELNNDIIPIMLNLLVLIDELTEVNANRLNQVISPAALSSRTMFSQKFRVLYTNAKLIIASNNIVRIEGNEGFNTRVFGIWMRHTFRALGPLDKVWRSGMHSPVSSTNWAIQRATGVYLLGIDAETVTTGLFLAIRHLFARYMDEKNIVRLLSSQQYERDTKEILIITDPFMAFTNFAEKHKSELASMSREAQVDWVSTHGEFEWTQKIKKNIIQRLESDFRVSSRTRAK